jgi:hypothetical protein
MKTAQTIGLLLGAGITLTSIQPAQADVPGLQGVTHASRPVWDADQNGWPDVGVTVWYQYTTTYSYDGVTITTVEGGWGTWDNSPHQTGGVFGQDQRTTARGLWHNKFLVCVHRTHELWSEDLQPLLGPFGVVPEWSYLTLRETWGDR